MVAYAIVAYATTFVAYATTFVAYATILAPGIREKRKKGGREKIARRSPKTKQKVTEPTRTQREKRMMYSLTGAGCQGFFDFF